MAEGLEAEATAFGELAVTETARNLIWLFLATQRARRRGPSVDQVGVVGAGFMGAAIAEVGAAAGLTVRLKDTSTEAVSRGLASVRHLVDGGVKRRRFDEREARAIQGRVSGGTDFAGFGRADVVIEAVFEDLNLKRTVLAELEATVGPRTVIASNTSAIPIHAIAEGARHPERVVGMHFFSPAERMPLLELVRPAAASDEAVTMAAALGARMGKTVIVVGDAPGFYTTRVLGAMLNEAALLVEEGARLEDVDQAITDFGFPVGPFVLYDEVGLGVAQHAGEGLASERFPSSTLVSELVAAGATGRTSGTGFYVWPTTPRNVPVVGRFVPKARRAANPLVYRGQPRKDFAEDDIRDRPVLLFVNEAVRCLDEQVLASPTDGDLGAVLGLGFPPFRGGPFHYADALGPKLVARLNALTEKHGERFAPAPSLVRGRRFFEEQP
jgi:3-hydroxyacyl-CoA dehydrogenase/enoyl-CoA hydratase/3-hydroxybutyryl-CoA epimerase